MKRSFRASARPKIVLIAASLVSLVSIASAADPYNAERPGLVHTRSEEDLFSFASVVGSPLVFDRNAPLAPSSAAPDLFWRTDGAAGTWTGTNWSNPAMPTGGTGWTSGSDAFFTADSLVTYVTGTLLADLTISPGFTTIVTAAGTMSAGTHVYDIGAGAALTWTNQNVSTGSDSNFTKDGAGTWNIGTGGINTWSGSFTLNAGTVIASGQRAFGGGAMIINGGTIQSSGTINFAVTSITVTDNFTLTGSGNSGWAAPVNLSGSVQTITNNATGTRTFSGVISNGGFTFEGTGTTILSGANTYTGPTNINGGTLTAAATDALGGTTNITVNSGTLLFSGATNDRINDLAEMTLNGGALDTAGLSEHGAMSNNAGIGALTLTSSSVIDMGSISSILAFANSSLATWMPGQTLNIYNWSGIALTGNGTDQVYFGMGVTGLTVAQLNSIRFYSDSGTTLLGTGIFAPDLDGEVIPTLVPVPEPATWIGGALALAAIGYTQRKRFVKRLANS